MKNIPSSSRSSVEKPPPGFSARGEDGGERLLRSGSIREALMHRPASSLPLQGLGLTAGRGFGVHVETPASSCFGCFGPNHQLISGGSAPSDTGLQSMAALTDRRLPA